MVALGRGGISGTIGDRLLALSPFGVIATFLSSAVLIWVGTQFAIPISISQCLIGGMFGAAFTKHVSAINTRLAVESMSSVGRGPGRGVPPRLSFWSRFSETFLKRLVDEVERRLRVPWYVLESSLKRLSNAFLSLSSMNLSSPVSSSIRAAANSRENSFSSWM